MKLNQTFTETEEREIVKVAAEGFFDEVQTICEHRSDGVWLNNPFGIEDDYQKYLCEHYDSLPAWIQRSASLIEFYSVLLELQGLLNALKDEMRTLEFLKRYRAAKDSK